MINLIIDNSNEQEPIIVYFSGDDIFTPYERRRGLPIGNLTSQLWANVYLNDFDHIITEKYGGTRYVRYMDDIALFSNFREELVEAKKQMNKILDEHRIMLHPIKTQIFKTKIGANFLGFRVFPDRIRVRQENLKRARKRYKNMQKAYKDGLISIEKITQSIQSWIAHLSYGDTWKLRKDILNSLIF